MAKPFSVCVYGLDVNKAPIRPLAMDLVAADDCNAPSVILFADLAFDPVPWVLHDASSFDVIEFPSPLMVTICTSIINEIKHDVRENQ